MCGMCLLRSPGGTIGGAAQSGTRMRLCGVGLLLLGAACSCRFLRASSVGMRSAMHQGLELTLELYLTEPFPRELLWSWMCSGAAVGHGAVLGLFLSWSCSETGDVVLELEIRIFCSPWSCSFSKVLALKY